MVQAVRIDLGKFQHEGVADDLAEHQLILAVEQQKGVEVQDGRDLLRSDALSVVELRQ